ncbi:MAG: hypothetical protein KDC34_02710 [Saprospiraceae bacterium]|nr:hypothetical protein [Saprospiraceae bacterium]
MKYFVPLVLLCSLIGCNSQSTTPEGFDYGSIEKGVYRNHFFNFSIDVPEDWSVQSDEMMDELSEAGTDMIAGDNKSLKQDLDAAEINTAYLLTVFKYEVGAPVDFNPSYLFVAENLSMAPTIRNGKDYLEESKKLLQQAAVEYQFPPVEQPVVNLGGKEFYVMNTVMEYIGTKIEQTYYACIDQNFALTCIISYSGEAQKQELETLLSSIKFL